MKIRRMKKIVILIAKISKGKRARSTIKRVEIMREEKKRNSRNGEKKTKSSYLRESKKSICSIEK